MLNTIARGFIGDSETSSACRRYALQVLSIKDLPEVKTEHEPQASEATIVFFEEDATDINPHNVDHMVITVKCE